MAAASRRRDQRSGSLARAPVLVGPDRLLFLSAMSSVTEQNGQSIRPRRRLPVAGPQFWRKLVAMLVVNLLVAVVLVTLNADYDPWQTFKTCNSIGFSIW